jgi:hypothetical protein
VRRRYICPHDKSTHLLNRPSITGPPPKRKCYVTAEAHLFILMSTGRAEIAGPQSIRQNHFLCNRPLRQSTFRSSSQKQKREQKAIKRRIANHEAMRFPLFLVGLSALYVPLPSCDVGQSKGRGRVRLLMCAGVKNWMSWDKKPFLRTRAKNPYSRKEALSENLGSLAVISFCILLSRDAGW